MRMATYCIISFRWRVQNKWIYIARNQVSDCQNLGSRELTVNGEGGRMLGDESVAYHDDGDAYLVE